MPVIFTDHPTYSFCIMRKLSMIVAFLLMASALQPGCKATKNSTASNDTPTTQSTPTPPPPPPAPEPPRPANPWVGKEIPFDQATRTGVLANGFTYYIRQNSKPENYAEFRLAVNAGSLMETDAQQGLAHFVEHMCFNGTENFPKLALVDYLESIGTKFGAHLNAYTSFDETVYMLRVPTDDPDKFQKGFQIMEDWAHNVTFEGEEIEKERGVVIEEWRTRLGASDRMMQKTLPKTFYNSRYAKRLPIGQKEILENFPHKELTDFYKDWYRPDLMALVIVGDFADMDAVERNIKEMFGAIPQTENPKPRPSYEVPDHAETLIAVVEDEEAPYNQAVIRYKHPLKTYEDVNDYRQMLIDDLASQMIDARLAEIAQGENPPFSFAGSGYGQMARTKDSYNAFCVVQPGGFMDGLRTILTENQRALQHGFTASELTRAKKSYLSDLEQQFREKDKTESRRLVMDYVYHYLEGYPAPGIENDLMLTQSLMPSVSLKDVNKAFQSFITDENRVITLMGTKNADFPMPTETAVRELLDEVKNTSLEAYTDNVSDAPLMEAIPAPGSVTATKKIEAIGVTELTLSNGVKVVLKPTDFQNDQIMMRAYSPGGSSLVSDEDYLSATYGIQAIMESGLGNYDNIQLDKFLSDKQLRVGAFVGELYEGMTGSTSPTDWETFMQMVHLYFTQPRKDEKAFNSSIAKTQGFYSNLMASPENFFRGEIIRVMGNGHPRAFFLPKPEQWEMVKLDKAFEIYEERFADASDFTFLFVGNFDPQEIQKDLNTYLASLPTLDREENWKDLGMEYPEGPINEKFYKGREPKSQVEMRFYGDFEWNGENRYNLNSTVQVLRILLRESMREDKGGVYGVGARATSSRDPKEEYEITISFTCSPDNAEDLIETALKDIKTLQEEGASDKNLQKVKETQRKELEVGMKQNRYWMNQLYNSYRYDLDPTRIGKLGERIDGLSSEDIQQAAKMYFDKERYAQFVLYPETEQEPKP
jgi:zinc protease